VKDSSNLDQNYRGVFDGRMGFGRSPAIIVVDFIRAYTTPGAPLYARAVVEAVKATAPLLVAGRRKGIPVIYTRVLYHPSGYDGGLFVRKVPVLRGMVEGEPLADIVAELPPGTDDVILDARRAGLSDEVRRARAVDQHDRAARFRDDAPAGRHQSLQPHLHAQCQAVSNDTFMAGAR
jgi:nicotinamidase-related amidase